MFLAQKLAYLKQERTFTYTGLASEKNKRAFNKASAEDSVQLSDTCVIADVAVGAYILKLEDTVGKIGGSSL